MVLGKQVKDNTDGARNFFFFRDNASVWPQDVVKVISGKVGKKECDPTMRCASWQIIILSRDGLHRVVMDLVNGYSNSLNQHLCQHGQEQGPIL